MNRRNETFAGGALGHWRRLPQRQTYRILGALLFGSAPLVVALLGRISTDTNYTVIWLELALILPAALILRGIGVTLDLSDTEHMGRWLLVLLLAVPLDALVGFLLGMAAWRLRQVFSPD